MDYHYPQDNYDYSYNDPECYYVEQPYYEPNEQEYNYPEYNDPQFENVNFLEQASKNPIEQNPQDIPNIKLNDQID